MVRIHSPLLEKTGDFQVSGFALSLSSKVHEKFDCGEFLDEPQPVKTMVSPWPAACYLLKLIETFNEMGMAIPKNPKITKDDMR